MLRRSFLSYLSSLLVLPSFGFIRESYLDKFVRVEVQSLDVRPILMLSDTAPKRVNAYGIMCKINNDEYLVPIKEEQDIERLAKEFYMSNDYIEQKNFYHFECVERKLHGMLATAKTSTVKLL